MKEIYALPPCVYSTYLRTHDRNPAQRSDSSAAQVEDAARIGRGCRLERRYKEASMFRWHFRCLALFIVSLAVLIASPYGKAGQSDLNSLRSKADSGDAAA